MPGITVRLNRHDNETLGHLSSALGAIAPTRAAVVSLLLRALPSASAILAAVARRRVGEDASPAPGEEDDGSATAAEVVRLHQDHDAAVRRLTAEHAAQLRRVNAEHEEAVTAAEQAAYERGREDESREAADRSVLVDRAWRHLVEDVANQDALRRIGIEVQFLQSGIVRLVDASVGAANGAGSRS